jgi:3-hydroxyacyl-[acyl-carrier-protein] dehydratase
MRFLFIDRILKLEPGKFIEAEHVFAGDQDFFQDHFPGFPVVPGVLLTEMMGQAAAMCLNAENLEKGRGRAILAQIRSASFRDWVRPDENAMIKAEIRASRDEFATAACSVEVRGHRVCSADLLFSYLPEGKLAPGYRDEVLESFLASRDPTKG